MLQLHFWLGQVRHNTTWKSANVDIVLDQNILLTSTKIFDLNHVQKRIVGLKIDMQSQNTNILCYCYRKFAN